MNKRLLILTLFTIFILSIPASAGWSQDGVLLHMTGHGTTNGGIYIGGGHGKEYTTSYNQNFTVPNGTVKWSRLYVSAKETTWINVTLNGHCLGNYSDLINHSKVYANYRTNLGMYWTYFDNAADWIVEGNNTATADLGTKVGFNTKSWGMALIVVYEGGDNPEAIEYRISEGNPLLHGNHAPFSVYNNNTTISFTDITDLNNVTGAELWTIYVWGSDESEGQQHDSLWLNSHLIAEDASDGAGTDDLGVSWRGACFDLEQWDVRHDLAQNNTILFDRGEDNILTPVGVVLVLKRYQETTTTDYTVDLNARILPAVSLEVTPGMLDYGVLAPGLQSNVQKLTLCNTGTNDITVTAEVIDTSYNLFENGLFLDSDNWNNYSVPVLKGDARGANTVLVVPDDYTGIGIQEANLILWAETN